MPSPAPQLQPPALRGRSRSKACSLGAKWAEEQQSGAWEPAGEEDKLGAEWAEGQQSGAGEPAGEGDKLGAEWAEEPLCRELMNSCMALGG